MTIRPNITAGGERRTSCCHWCIVADYEDDTSAAGDGESGCDGTTGKHRRGRCWGSDDEAVAAWLLLWTRRQQPIACWLGAGSGCGRPSELTHFRRLHYWRQHRAASASGVYAGDESQLKDHLHP